MAGRRNESGFEASMSDADDLMWTIESDPILRSTITAVSLLDRPPDWDRVVRRMERAAGVIPRLHQRVKTWPFRLARPEWVDTDFDLDYHLRRIALPGRPTLDDALHHAAAMAVGGFDVERPLWEFVVVEGLVGGQAALIQKVHHTVTDGIGAMRLALEILDAEPNPAEAVDSDTQRVPPAPPSTLAHAMRGQLVDRLRTTAAALKTIDPRHILRTATSVGHMLRPVTQPMSPVLIGRGMSWDFTCFDVPLADLRRTGKRNGGTVNDAFVAGITIGLQRYHAALGETPPMLRMTLPVNLRRPGDPLGGNRFTPLRFALPIDGPGGDERVKAVAAVIRKERAEPAVALTPLLAAALDSLPGPVVTPVFGGMLKNVDFVSTNVPGISFRCWFGGAEVPRQYAFAPPSGAALNIALVSHGETGCIGVAADRTPVSDSGLLTRCLADAFAELVGPAAQAA